MKASTGLIDKCFTTFYCPQRGPRVEATEPLTKGEQLPITKWNNLFHLPELCNNILSI